MLIYFFICKFKKTRLLLEKVKGGAGCLPPPHPPPMLCPCIHRDCRNITFGKVEREQFITVNLLNN